MIKVISDGPYVAVEIEHDTQQEAENEFRSLGYSIAYKMKDEQMTIALNALAEGLIKGHETKQKETKKEREEKKNAREASAWHDHADQPGIHQ